MKRAEETKTETIVLQKDSQSSATILGTNMQFVYARDADGDAPLCKGAFCGRVDVVRSCGAN